MPPDVSSGVVSIQTCMMLFENHRTQNVCFTWEVWVTILPLHNSTSPQLHNSTTQPRNYSTTPQLHNSTTPQLHNSTTPQLHTSTSPLLHSSTTPYLNLHLCRCFGACMIPLLIKWLLTLKDTGSTVIRPWHATNLNLSHSLTLYEWNRLALNLSIKISWTKSSAGKIQDCDLVICLIPAALYNLVLGKVNGMDMWKSISLMELILVLAKLQKMLIDWYFYS